MKLRSGLNGGAGGRGGPRREEGVDELRKIRAVTAFEDRGGGYGVAGVGFGEPGAEGGEVVAFERHCGDGIADIGVEAGGNEDEVGGESDDGVERRAKGGKVLRARGTGRDGPVADIRRNVGEAGAGVAGRLMDGGEEERTGGSVDGRGENGFGAVAVMGVEIPNSHAAGAEVVVRVESGDGDVVEVTEAHRGIGGGVMAGRTHEGESGRAGGEGVLGRGDRGGGGAAGVVGDGGEIGRVGVEVVGLGKAAQVRGSVGAKECGVGDGSGGRRDTEFPPGVRGAEVGGGTDDAGGLLGAHGRAVIGALRIVEDEHGHESDGRKKAQKAQVSKGHRESAIFSFALCGVLCGYGPQL